MENLIYFRKTKVRIPRRRLNHIYRAKSRASKTPIILSSLARELECEIPNVDIYGSERKLLDFAYKDLETWLIEKLSKSDFVDLEKSLEDESRKDEIKAFLKIWTKKWLEKWRERVTLCQKLPQFSLQHLKLKKKASKILDNMKESQELKKLVVQRLIDKGELCMVGLISENLILEEIAFRLKMKDEKASNGKTVFDSLSILQEVTSRIKSLAERKTPIIHLKLMTDI